MVALIVITRLLLLLRLRLLFHFLILILILILIRILLHGLLIDQCPCKVDDVPLMNALMHWAWQRTRGCSHDIGWAQVAVEDVTLAEMADDFSHFGPIRMSVPGIQR